MHLQTLFLISLALPLVAGKGVGSWIKRMAIGEHLVKQPEDFALALVQAIEAQQAPEARMELVINMLDAYKPLPSCNRHAWSGLITSCNDFKSSPSSLSNDRQLDDIKFIFATRLAVCELLNVNVSIVPAQCSAFLSTDTYPENDIPYHQRCLQALHGDNRSWVSYSNAKQNAHMICEASAKHVEKDDMLDFQQSMLEVAKMSLQTHARNVDSMNDLTAELNKLVSAVDRTVHTHVKLTSHVTDLEQTLSSSLKSLHNASHTASSLQYSLEQSSSDLTAYNLQAQSIFSSTLVVFSNMASTAGETFRSMLNGFTAEFAAQMEVHSDIIKGAIHKAVQLGEISTATAQRILTNLDTVDNRVVSHNEKMLQAMIEQANASIAHVANITLEVQKIKIPSFGNLLAASAINSFTSMPAVVMVIVYIAILSASVRLIAGFTRKLASMPFTTGSSFLALIVNFIKGSAWPIPIIITAVSIYGAFIEEPLHLFTRLALLDFQSMDVYLGLAIMLPIVIYSIVPKGDEKEFGLPIQAQEKA